MKQFRVTWASGNQTVIDREGCETVDELVASLWGSWDPRDAGAIIEEYPPKEKEDDTPEETVPEGAGGGQAGSGASETGPEVW